MALRVLLADESSTIKKVFQLALQDFAVEVQSVNVGLDVVEVAQKFNPDIVFADVLLQKRSGYEVSADLKNHETLKNIPVVLMWSGFMDLDEDKFQASQANGQLEKPFDVQGLRHVIEGLVSKTKTQNLAEFLDFPEMPEIQETPPDPVQETPSVNKMLNLPDSSAPPVDVEANNWDMESFAPIDETAKTNEPPPLHVEDEDFRQVDLPPVIQKPPVIETESPQDFLSDYEEDGTWIRKDISKYKVDADANIDEDVEPGASVNYVVSEEPIDSSDFIDTHSGTVTTFSEREIAPEEERPLPGAPEDELEVEEVPRIEIPDPEEEIRAMRLSEEKLEAIVRAQSAEMLEKVIWKVVPDLASRIIERELDRLLKDRDL